MSLRKSNELVNKLEDIATFSISNSAVPVITRAGILVGNVLIRIKDGNYYLRHKKTTVYQTHTKTAALILAGLINKNYKGETITNILEADRTAFSTKNDLEIFKHHYQTAIKNNDKTKQGIMLARFEQADDRYQSAKQILKQSYSKLFYL
jgi:hypothetical protein